MSSAFVFFNISFSIFPSRFFFAIGPHDLSLSITDRKIEILKKEECEIRNAEHLDKG